MPVNSVSRAFSSPGSRLAAATVIPLCAIVLFAAFVVERPDTLNKRVNLAIRAIGHNLLLRDGDSTSLVRPVIERPGGVYVLEFEREFGFQPDTLISLAHRFLSRTGLSGYTVTVHECNGTRMVYGFEIDAFGEANIACRGRRQPQACYSIEIAFADFPEPKQSYSRTAGVIAGILSLLTIVLVGTKVVVPKAVRQQEQHSPVRDESDPTLALGKFEFDPANRTLTLGSETTVLTDKECRVLTLLSRNFGKPTLREDLIQEVWTDDGVITGRSLDMFVSRLRKKLSGDPALRITTIHGKGYRLEIVNGTAG